jgi:SsrA-binding protein
MARSNSPSTHKVISRNKKALHDFFIEERIEAGIVLLGTEVKSLRNGRANLKDAYAQIKDGEVFLFNLHISEWPGAAYFNHEPERERKLLLHAHQIHRLNIQVNQRGYTLVGLSIYFNENNKIKVELGLAKGKQKQDKRHAIRERDERRNAERELTKKSQ